MEEWVFVWKECENEIRIYWSNGKRAGRKRRQWARVEKEEGQVVEEEERWLNLIWWKSGRIKMKEKWNWWRNEEK